MGIGTTNPGNARLKIRGSSTSSSDQVLFLTDSNDTTILNINNNGSGWASAPTWYGSDRRLKKNIEYFSDGLDKILKLKPVKFDYISGINNNLGFIAQDVQEVIPEAVAESKENNGMLYMKSDFIIPELVNAIKELKAQNDALELRLKALEGK